MHVHGNDSNTGVLVDHKDERESFRFHEIWTLSSVGGTNIWKHDLDFVVAAGEFSSSCPSPLLQTSQSPIFWGSIQCSLIFSTLPFFTPAIQYLFISTLLSPFLLLIAISIPCRPLENIYLYHLLNFSVHDNPVLHQSHFLYRKHQK